MKLFTLLAALPVAEVVAFSFNAYDLGFQGIYPRQHFHSVDFEPPKPRITAWDYRCDPGNIFLTPRGPYVNGAARGPVILNPKGDLIWMDNGQWEQAMNFNVQKYKGKDYLTFWTKGKKVKGEGKDKEKKKGKDEKKGKKEKDGKKKKEGKKGKKEEEEEEETKEFEKKKEKREKKKGGHKKSKKSYVMLNKHYEVTNIIKPVGTGLKGDSHEFRITPQGTALITIYHKHEADCTELGLGKSCWIQDGLFQEIDIETGELLFEWRATDHISMREVYTTPNRKDGHGKSKSDAFDFFHINSVDKIDSGDYIISARYMHAVACISAKTGEILWQLGGKHNSFEDLDSATDFAWQHHVTWQGNDTISVFDNHANTVLHGPSKHSKGMVIKLDMEGMTASLVGKYVHPDEILNVSQGSVQLLNETGNVLVGFGNSPTYIEYSATTGEVLCAAHFGPHLIFELVDFGLVKSYRIFKQKWVGKPKTKPDVKVKNGKVYVSWNGATEVTGWRLETARNMGALDEEFVAIKALAKEGFETTFTLDKTSKYVRVAALGSKKKKGGVLAYSAVVRARKPSSASFWSTVFFFMFGFASLIFLQLKYHWHPHVADLRHFSFKDMLYTLNTKLHDLRWYLKARWQTGVKLRRGSHQSYESEEDPLLLNEIDP